MRAAEILLEAVKDERALDLFAQAAADGRDDGEDERLRRRLNQILQRVLFHVVQRREEDPRGRQHDDGQREHDGREPDAELDFGTDRARAQEHVARALAAAAQQPEDQRDQQRRVEQQQRRDVAERQPSAHVGRKSGQREHVRQRELRRDAGAQQNLENGRDPRDGKRVRLGFWQGSVRDSKRTDFTRETDEIPRTSRPRPVAP